MSSASPTPAPPPLFTIGIPVYRARFLAQALDSVFRQTCQDFEVVVVDDASPDDVESVVKRYPQARLTYHRLPQNLGAKAPARTWNRVLGLARGRYFCLLGDDDWLSPGFLSEMARLSRAYPDVALLHGVPVIADADGTVVEYGPTTPEYETWDCFVYYRNAGKRLSFTTEYMARTADLRDLGGFLDFPYAWGSDDATWMSLARKGGGSAASNLAYGYWRRHGANVSYWYRPGRWRACDQFFAWMDGFLHLTPTPATIPLPLLLAGMRARQRDQQPSRGRRLLSLAKRAILMKPCREGGDR